MFWLWLLIIVTDSMSPLALSLFLNLFLVLVWIEPPNTEQSDQGCLLPARAACCRSELLVAGQSCLLPARAACCRPELLVVWVRMKFFASPKSVWYYHTAPATIRCLVVLTIGSIEYRLPQTQTLGLWLLGLHGDHKMSGGQGNGEGEQTKVSLRPRHSDCGHYCLIIDNV